MEIWAKELSNRNKKDLADVKHGLDLWLNSPEKFIPDPNSLWNNKHRHGIEDYIRTDGEKSRYSYLATFKQFKGLEWYKTVYAEVLEEFEKFDKFEKSEQKYLYDIMKQKQTLTVQEINKLTFDFV